ncbi:MAG: chemotaxis protein CheA [Planctomycetota bacterium]|jgi:two-component system chemotaxis sensor kinase CheA|nr:chemotaxis protein CheA [Planctomycetota bacterium]
MISQELLQSFISEASDLLDDIEPSLVGYPRLEDEAERMEVVNRVFRHFHSIKGSAGFVGLHDIAKLTHEAETLLEQYRRTPTRVIPNDTIAILCRTVDFLRLMFTTHIEEEGTSGDESATVEFNQLIDEIFHSIRQAQNSPERHDTTVDISTGEEIPEHGKHRTGGVVRTPPASAEKEEKSTAAKTTRISRNTEIRPKVGKKTKAVRRSKTEGVERQPRVHESSDTARIIRANNQGVASKLNSAEFLGRYVAEANELLEEIEQALLQAEQHPELGNEAVQEALRCLHSFKGNSGLMNFRDLERLSHRMESEVETIIGKDIGLDAATFDVLLRMIDVLKQAMADLGMGGNGDIPDADTYIAMLDDSTNTRSTATRISASDRSSGLQLGPGAKERLSAPPPAFFDDEQGKETETSSDWLKPRGRPSVQENLASAGRANRIVMGDPNYETAGKPVRPDVAEPNLAATPVRRDMLDAREREKVAETEFKADKTISDPDKSKRLSGQKITVSPRNDIRVDLNKLDAMLDLVGELIIAEAMVTRHPVVSDADNESLERAVHQLRRVANSLQDMAMSVRMIPLVSTFRRMIRLVYDLSIKAGKQVDLILLGEETEVDRTVIERISDPMVHIIRNAIDHGIEPPEERERLGKPGTGRVTIEGRHEGGEVWIIITDDGRGLDRDGILKKAIDKGLVSGDGSDLTDKQVYHLIFEPGFSTAAQVTDISGRGFGMDVVKKNIEKLSGKIDIRTRPGEGMAVILRIPLTLAIIEGMLVRAGEARYIIPLLSIRESLKPELDQILHTPDGQPIIKLRDELIPIVMLNEVFRRVNIDNSLEDGILMVVEGEYGGTVALFADELLGQQETVIKGLTGWMKKSRGVSGCTILGDGEVGLILDISAIVQLAGRAVV